MLQELKDSFGETPTEEYSEEKYQSLQYYHRTKPVDSGVLDEITWNDLDMDSLYMQLNRTSCAMGEEYLYDMLRRPLYDEEALAERARVIEFLGSHEKERLGLQFAFAKIGKFPRISLYEYYNRAKGLAPRSMFLDLMQDLLFAVAVALLFFLPEIGGPAAVLMIGVNVVTYYKRKNEIEPYLQVFAYLVRLTGQAEGIKKLSIPELSEYLGRIEKGAGCFLGFRKRAWLINSGSSMSGDLADIIMDYIRILFHVDLIKFSSMLATVQAHGEELDRIFEAIGFLDSCIAAASFRVWLGDWCVPELTKGSESIRAVGLYHPLLEEPVKNNYPLPAEPVGNEAVLPRDPAENGRPLWKGATGQEGLPWGGRALITGSNASGKSTFLKSLAVNAVLAQTLSTAVCDSYEAGYFRIYSSMALTDNLFGGESYYMVEIKSLKRILDAADEAGAAPILCFIDEVLRGTNTLERIAASSQILSVLAGKRVLAFAATHDLELTHILGEQYANYHFSEEVQEQDIHFDYLLKPGRAQSRNAIKLLALLGFAPEITQAAEERAARFQATGEWGW